MADNISEIAQVLIKDKDFNEMLERQIKEIMKDGKVNAYDIPEIIMIITECYNNVGRVKLTYEQLPDILNDIVTYIFNKFNLMPDEEEEQFRKMINMAIRLVMLKPVVKKYCLKIASKLNCCKK